MFMIHLKPPQITFMTCVFGEICNITAHRAQFLFFLCGGSVFCMMSSCASCSGWFPVGAYHKKTAPLSFVSTFMTSDR